MLAGAVAGPLFVVVVIAQALSHEAFRLADHPLSLLALGNQGWIQTANFLVCGAAFVAAAIAERRTTNHLTAWTTRMIVVFGTAFIIAGLMRADPWHGYPVDTTETTSWHGVIHNAAAAIAGLALLVATIITARHALKNDNTTRAITTIVIGVVYFVLSTIGSATSDFRLALAAGALIWCWTSATLATAGRATSASRPRPIPQTRTRRHSEPATRRPSNDTAVSQQSGRNRVGRRLSRPRPDASFAARFTGHRGGEFH